MTTQSPFAVGTFTPDPRPAAVPKMLVAQFGLELKLLLRNGEQLLLTMFIPITLLIGLTLLPLGSFGDNRAATFVPAIMALAVISTAFTGQAIAVAFDRRYGALKRLGATALPVWGIIAGKSAHIERIRTHPLMRALRVDKMTYAALEATLVEYAAGRAETTIPDGGPSAPQRSSGGRT